MSDRRLRAALAAAGLLLAATAQAQLLDLHDLLPDPLHATARSGMALPPLPADAQAVACPAPLDLQQPLALGQAVQAALCNSPRAQAAWAGVLASAAALGEARAAYLPSLQVGTSRLHTATTYPAAPALSAAQSGNALFADLSWRLFDFGARQAHEAAADADLSAALASRDASLQTLIGSVLDAYFSAVTAQAALAARDEAVRLAEATLASAQRKEDRGAAGHGDVLQARTALARAALARTRAQGDGRKALALLIYTIGLPTESPLRVPVAAESEAGTPAADLRQSLGEWLDAAQHAHPAIVAARAELVAAQQRVSATRRDGLPTLDLTASQYRNGYPGQGLAASDSRVSTIGVTLTIPLFDGFARSYRIQSAQAQADQRGADLRDTTQQVLKDVVAAHSDAVAAVGNLADSETLLGAARAAQESSQRRYDKGASDVNELLSVQGALADARLERVQAVADWRSASLRLWVSVGRIGVDLMGGGSGSREAGR